jgi:hypothetical protein
MLTIPFSFLLYKSCCLKISKKMKTRSLHSVPERIIIDKSDK